MARHHVFARTEYADPLSHEGEVDSDGVPDLATATDRDDWLEVAVIPDDAMIWVIRDGHLVEDPADRPRQEATA